MALFGDNKLFFCLFFIACCYLRVALTDVPVDCCLSVLDLKVQKHIIVDYRQQVGGQGCALDATILVTRRGRCLCAPANKQWITKIMEHVNKLKKSCKKNNYRGRPCTGVKPE